MDTFPNQKVITKFDYAECSQTELYAKINIDAMQVAAQDLKPSSLIVWLYLSKNTHKGNYKEALSFAAMKYWGISEKSYRNAVKELIEKGYLEQTGGNTYIFHQMPIDVSSYENTGGKIYRIEGKNLPEYAVNFTRETLQDTTNITYAAAPQMEYEWEE